MRKSQLQGLSDSQLVRRVIRITATHFVLTGIGIFGVMLALSAWDKSDILLVLRLYASAIVALLFSLVNIQALWLARWWELQAHEDDQRRES